MSRLAVYFPGIGYHYDKPLLYYGREIGCERGYENYINVQYTYKSENIRGDLEKMTQAFHALYEQAQQCLKEVSWEKYEEVLFVSKSIGTIIASAYAKEHGLKNVKHVLYTPLTQTFMFGPQNAIAFIGTADGWSDVDKVIAMAKDAQIPITVYEDCNHSLECKDTLRNMDILKDVMEKTKDFI